MKLSFATIADLHNNKSEAILFLEGGIDVGCYSFIQFMQSFLRELNNNKSTTQIALREFSLEDTRRLMSFLTAMNKTNFGLIKMPVDSIPIVMSGLRQTKVDLLHLEAMSADATTAVMKDFPPRVHMLSLVEMDREATEKVLNELPWRIDQLGLRELASDVVQLIMDRFPISVNKLVLGSLSDDVLQIIYTALANDVNRPAIICSNKLSPVWVDKFAYLNSTREVGVMTIKTIAQVYANIPREQFYIKRIDSANYPRACFFKDLVAAFENSSGIRRVYLEQLSVLDTKDLMSCLAKTSITSIGLIQMSVEATTQAMTLISPKITQVAVVKMDVKATEVVMELLSRTKVNMLLLQELTPEVAEIVMARLQSRKSGHIDISILPMTIEAIEVVLKGILSLSIRTLTLENLPDSSLQFIYDRLRTFTNKPSIVCGEKISSVWQQKFEVLNAAALTFTLKRVPSVRNFMAFPLPPNSPAPFPFATPTQKSDKQAPAGGFVHAAPIAAVDKRSSGNTSDSEPSTKKACNPVIKLAAAEAPTHPKSGPQMKEKSSEEDKETESSLGTVNVMLRK